MSGQTFVTLVSDDNFLPIQQTQIVEFRPGRIACAHRPGNRKAPLSAIPAGQVAAPLQKTVYILTRTYLPGILAMATIVVASNILVQFLYGQWLTWGAFTYPFAFLVTDVMNRVYGASAARRVVLVGFVVGLICSLIGTQIMGEFGPLVTLRIAIGSGVAFLAAQLLDVSIFAALRGGAWWRAPLISTLIGSTVDTALFFGIAFPVRYLLCTLPRTFPGRLKFCRCLALVPAARSGFRLRWQIGP